MGRGKRFEPKVPGKTAPDNCKCGKPARHTIKATIELMGKEIPVTFRVCEEHNPLPNLKVSIVEK